MITPDAIGTIIATDVHRRSQRPTESTSTIIARQSTTRSILLENGEVISVSSSTIIKKIRQVPSYITTDIPPSMHYHAMCKVAQKAGFRVPPTSVVDRKRVEILDVSRGGKFFDKSLAAEFDPICESEEFTDDPNAPVFQHFLTMYPRVILPAIQIYVDQATQQNLWVPDDDAVNLLIFPCGHWELWMLDPEKLRVYNPATEEYHSTRHCYRADSTNSLPPHERNRRSIEKFYIRMAIIQRELKRMLQ